MPQATQAVASPLLLPSQPGILRSKSNSDMSTSSSESKAPTITFAPLPRVEARKRRNSRPIGIAGRAELLRRTRRQFDPTFEDNQNSLDDDEIIPLPDVGKLVKGFWRTVSGMQKNNSRPPNTSTVVEGGGGEGKGLEEVAWPSSSNPPFPEERPPMLKEEALHR